MSNKIENEFKLREAIIKVIAFFDLFDYALTDLEIWRMLSVKCELSEVMEELEKMVDKSPLPPFIKGGIIESINGFYFLAGREENIKTRLSRYNFTDRKFKRAIFAVKIFRFIPWIRLIAVGNLMGAHNLRDDGDIDFFIVTEARRLWLSRFFCAGLAEILGLRPRAYKSRDKICLSFYVSEGAMDLSGLLLKSLPPPLIKGGLEADIYFIYWLAGVTPIYDVGGIYEELIKANQWLFTSLPNWRLIEPIRRRQVKPLARGFYHDLMDLFCGGLEPQFKTLQLKLLPARLKNLINQDSRVVINDRIIKLHANDRRREYREEFNEKIRQLFKNFIHEISK